MSEPRQGGNNYPGLTSFMLLGMGLLLVFLLVRAPASLLQRAVPAASGLAVSGWGGTVWSGQMAWAQADASGLLSWRLRPLSLLRGRASADITAQGSVPLTGRVELGLHRMVLEQIQGEVPVAMFQPVLPEGWTLPGVLRAEGLDLARAGFTSGAWTAATGHLDWAGGSMQFSLNGQPQQATLPPLRIMLRLEGDSLVLALAEASSGLALAQVQINPQGQAETQVRERLLRYNPSYRSGGADPDAVVATSRSAS